MEKATKSQTIKKRIIIFIFVNIVILSILYSIPNQGLNIELCIYKNLTGRECINCGMTRAFLSIIHLDFEEAIRFNKNVIIVFPLTVFVYIYTWYNYIVRRKEKTE